MLVNDVTLDNNIVYEWNGNGANLVDGEALNLGAAANAMYVSNIQVLNNNFHISNSNPIGNFDPPRYMRLIQSPNENSIIASGNNRMYGAMPEIGQFLMGTVNYNYDLAGYMSFVGDTTSTGDQTTPSGPYGITDYLSSIGETATFDSYYANLATQRKGNWDNRYSAIPVINYVRNSFGRASISPDYTNP